MARLRDLPRNLMKLLVRGYSYIMSPLIGPNCRFHPTCSAYAVEAIDTHGAVKGGYLAFRRVLKCHPWNKGPFLDPVPHPVDCGGSIGYKRREAIKEEKDHAKP